MKIIRLIIAVLRDECGKVSLGSIATIGGSALLGGLLGKTSNGTYNSQYDYSELSKNLSDLINKKVTSDPTQYTSPTQSAVQKAVLGKIDSLSDYSPEDNSAVTEKYYQARKARAADDFEAERQKTTDRYNRLGLVSSTPTMTALGDIDREETLFNDELGSQLMYEDINREETANQNNESNLQSYLGQGLTLGNLENNQYQFGENNQQNWAQLGGNLLSGNKSTYTDGEQNLWSQLAQGGMDIGTILALAGLA